MYRYERYMGILEQDGVTDLVNQVILDLVDEPDGIKREEIRKRTRDMIIDGIKKKEKPIMVGNLPLTQAEFTLMVKDKWNKTFPNAKPEENSRFYFILGFIIGVLSDYFKTERDDK